MSTLYLKRVRLPDDYHYILRQTYSDNGILKSRDLLDMGRDPSAYIRYPGGSGFYFDPAVEDALKAKGVRFSSEDLEDVFEPFLIPRCRDIIKRFRNRRGARSRVKCDIERPAPDQGKVHIFDARRLYFLRFGRMDSGELGARHWKFLNVFLCKARDEIEDMIEKMELRLPPGEYASYAYSALGVPLFFSQHMREHPSALDQDRLDGHIIEELCRLNSDETFFLGVDRGERNGLHPYLTKYAWLYFDFNFLPEVRFEASWFDSSFRRQPVPPPKTVSVDRALQIFGIPADKFSGMSGKDLARLYRRKAKKMHPDSGGMHDDFVELSEAYEKLMGIKKSETGV